MDREDPFELADVREREAEELERRGRDVRASVEGTREDWERKRADRDVPGAPPREDDDSEEPHSPAPQAPPPSAGPADAETPAEGAAGPPADVVDDD